MGSPDQYEQRRSWEQIASAWGALGRCHEIAQDCVLPLQGHDIVLVALRK